MDTLKKPNQANKLQIKKDSTEDVTEKSRKPRATKPKITEIITAKSTTNIKTNTKTNKLKEAADNFKLQKQIEKDTIKQQLRDHRDLTKGAAALNKSLAKLEAKQNKNKTN